MLVLWRLTVWSSSHWRLSTNFFRNCRAILAYDQTILLPSRAYYLEVHGWSAESCKAEIPFLHNHFPEWSTALGDKVLQLGWQMVKRHFDRMRGVRARDEKGRQYIQSK